ncbi:hypothetical protein [Demequina sediminicola]|uniref:hypothetical protein n=1 Tax=Demequina sediminicola TaxID=1095026 RepID=UPI000784D013|nr:hypothetical protein [Demequina sediminicola]
MRSTDVSFEERHTAIGLVIAVAAVAVYLVVVTIRAITDGLALTDVAWQGPMLACIGIGAGLYAAVYASLWWRRRSETLTDERDEQIRAAGEESGSAFTGLAIVATLVMLALDVDTFWIAHVLLLASFAGALTQSATVLAAYRGSIA